MSTLEYTIYGIKRGLRFSRTFIFSGAFAALLVNGIFAAEFTGTHRTIVMAMFAVWTLLFGFKVYARFFTPSQSESSLNRTSFELGLMLVLATHAGIQMAGGFASPYYPALFVLVAFLVVYTSQWVGFTLVVVTILLEFAVIAAHPSDAGWQQAILHGVFVALFSVINLIFTRTEVTRVRHKALQKIEQEKQQLHSDARAFRLTSATTGRDKGRSRQEEEERLSRCTVSEVRRAMYQHVDLLKQTMDLNTCILFWQKEGKRTLRVLECVTDSDAIAHREYNVKEGVVGAIYQSGRPMALRDLRPGHPSLVYYSEETTVTDFIGVPIREGAAIHGVLCGDRKNNHRFSERDKAIFSASVESILQNVSNERVFVQLQKAKSEQSLLLSASESLSKALSTSDVVRAALDAAALIAPFDMAAVTLNDGEDKQRVIEARGDNAEQLASLEMTTRCGLAGSVYKTGHYLPYRGNFDAKQQIVYTKKAQSAFERMCSLLVLPLSSGDEVLGTLMMASATVGVYTEEIRTTLQVMINQLGTKLQNAAMVQQLRELATTDGLTGLPNHRSFQDELTRQLAHSSRFGKPTSVILCDVDKFKGVNDTYGHTVGDIVLKALGETLRRNVVRDTDMPARYGGEEFVIVCGGTDTAGAVQLGERIRKDLERQVFHTDKGELCCTISMGVAEFPLHANSREDLVERADLALYAAKEGGRNQVRVWTRGMVK
ncbi:MAG: GGDEF domain-containing protein [Deltaproteobacteria bacterium]|nr:GGDEF domain-containing protein [Deltaproteobacteria bacterium]